jgi:type I restriction-modification system DNA methylase subunit
MKYDQQIISLINDMSKYYSPHQVFSDWMEMYAISIANACTLLNSKLKQNREQKYIEIVKKYKEVEQNRFPELCGMLVLALEQDMVDVLGNVYMGLESGSKHTGQFFTPNHISRLTARLMPLVTDTDGIIKFTEPTCGSGGMIIAYAKSLSEQGVNYQKKLEVIAQDIDYRCVHMCYVQLSLLGIKATVIRQNTLTLEEVPEDSMFLTPAKMGVLV